MYESPIKVFRDQMNVEYDGAILRAVQRVDVTVDKDELIKAIRYDRDQYEKGYRDAMEEVRFVRCKDCIHWTDGVCGNFSHEDGITYFTPSHGYCHDAEKEDKDEAD